MLSLNRETPIRINRTAALVFVSTYVAQEPGTEPGGNILEQNIDFRSTEYRAKSFARHQWGPRLYF
jgi:hypothetical protein